MNQLIQLQQSTLPNLWQDWTPENNFSNQGRHPLAQLVAMVAKTDSITDQPNEQP